MGVEAERGDYVSVHYEGTLDDGSVFDTSYGKEPLKFALGWREVISGFDKAVLGMKPGETKKVKISCSEAYGPRNENLKDLVPKSDFDPEIELRPGIILQVDHPDGKAPQIVTLLEVFPTTVMVDYNHPLAGRDLNFDIKLLEIL